MKPCVRMLFGFGSMTTRSMLAAVTALGLVSGVDAIGADEGPAPQKKLSSAELAQRIDALLLASWEREGVVPAPPVGDAEFLRRVSIDLSGKIPSVHDCRDFLADSSPQKRRVVVERLLGRATFATHFANRWRDLLLPGANNNVQTRAVVPQFEDWLRLRFAADTPYDKLVEEILTYRMPDPDPRQQVVRRGRIEPNPGAFQIINERKAESLASSSASVFLGVQVQCAQCHDHPFADWKQDQFWSFAAFFKEPDGKGGEKLDIEIPETKQTVQAIFLDGAEPKPSKGDAPRDIAARWITEANNPYFSRATVNRLWDLMFGHGLVDPVNDLDPSNEPTHPEVLDLLARQFAAHDFDLKFILESIALTGAYQLGSESTHASQEEWRHFARMPLRGLTGEQLFDSVVQATGYQARQVRNRNNPFRNLDNARERFLAKFSDAAAPVDQQATILQALTLMNGRILSDATSLTESETLRAILEAPFFEDADRVDTLYLATLSRLPEEDEKTEMLEYVRPKTTDEERKQALADIFWALMNSPEFVLVH